MILEGYTTASKNLRICYIQQCISDMSLIQFSYILFCTDQICHRHFEKAPLQKSGCACKSLVIEPEATVGKEKNPRDGMRKKSWQEPDSNGNLFSSEWHPIMGLQIITFLLLYTTKSNNTKCVERIIIPDPWIQVITYPIILDICRKVIIRKERKENTQYKSIN